MDMDDDDISIPLSLIKALRRPHGVVEVDRATLSPAVAATAVPATAVPAASGSSDTSEKDGSSGADERGGSNLSSAIDAFGPISSLSGSEGGYINVGGGRTARSVLSTASYSSESQCVVVGGKTVTPGPGAGGGASENRVSFSLSRQAAMDIGEAAAPSPPNAEGKADAAEEGGRRCGRSTQYRILGNDAEAEETGRTSKPPPSNKPLLATVSFTSSTSARAPEKDGSSSNVPPSSPTRVAKRKRPQSPSKPSREERRLERNQREKERSNRISSQVDALRSLLQRGGLFIPKNTRSTVLSEAGNYIRTLQDRQQLMSMEMEGLKRQLTESMTARAASAFPPQEGGAPADDSATSVARVGCGGTGEDARDYQLIFKNTMAGMAVASLGGALLDINSAFQSSVGLPADRLSGMTIFNIVHPTDLPRALDLISRMIERGCSATVAVRAGTVADAAASPNPGGDAPEESPNDEPVILRSSFRERPDVGLCVTLIRGKDGIAKCFNVTLVKNGPRTNGLEERRAAHSIPFDPSLPILPSMASCTQLAGGIPTPSDRMTSSPGDPGQLLAASAEGVDDPADQSLQADKGTMVNKDDDVPAPKNMQPGTDPSQLAQLAPLTQQQEQLRQMGQSHAVIDGQGQPPFSVSNTTPGWPLLAAPPQEVSAIPEVLFRMAHDPGTSNAIGCAAFQMRSEQLEEAGGPAYYASG